MNECRVNFISNTLNKIKRHLAILLFLALAAVLTMPLDAFAQDSPKTVRVGWYESPFNKMDRFGRRSGYAYEYQEKIAAYTGWNYEFVEGSWPVLLDMLLEGKLDLLSDVSYTDKRAESILYPSLPMGTEKYFLFISPNNKAFTPGDYAYFNGKKFGVNQNSIQTIFLQEWAKNNGIQIEIIELTCTEAQSFQMLNNGEIDVFVTMDSYGGSESGIPVANIGLSEFFFAVNKNRQDLLDELNAAMVRIQNENRYYNQQLSDKYLNFLGANAFLNKQEIDWLSGHGKIRIGYRSDYAPFCASDKETGKLTGALKDYLDDASNCLENASLEFEPVAYHGAAAAIEALRKGEVDCMFPSNLGISDGEKLGLVMTPSLITDEAYLLVRKDVQQSFFGKEHISVAIEAGNPNYVAVTEDLFPNWLHKDYADVHACLKAVADGEVDCFVVSNYQYNVLKRQCKKLGLTPVPSGENVESYIAINKGNTELYSILTKTTNIISDSNLHSALSYYSAENTKSTLVESIQDHPAVYIVLLTVIFALLFIIFAQQRIILKIKARLKEQA